MRSRRGQGPKGAATGTVGSGLGETARTVVYALLIAVVVRTFLFEPFNIPSGSMIPTLQVGDYLFVWKPSYGFSRFSLPFSPNLFSGRILFREPHRGDVAVFRFTRDNSIDYIKRIVGLPGDRIQVREGRLFLNGQEVPRREEGDYVAVDEHRQELQGRLYEESLPGSAGRPPVNHQILRLTDEGPQNDTPVYTVPDGYFFAMGDNRDDSADSRFMDDLGYVPMENLVGRAEMIFFSFDGRHPTWQFWYWPVEIRWNRLFRWVH
ncbi:signal peptidase I [Rhizosaccharibacter radicis]|uniref:Signal peptidase I n=1 Tax=Rhizosaccharibacter radicis TaxID=2782605 RepID=A0ABT1VV87_9PROT|nr:signal peptidase I [Acetobacteraceae bacterium KSS12]